MKAPGPSLLRIVGVAIGLAILSPLVLVVLVRSLPEAVVEMGPAGADYLQGARGRFRFDGEKRLTSVGRRSRVDLPLSFDGGSVVIALRHERTSPTRLEVRFDDGSSEDLLLSESTEFHVVTVALPRTRTRANVRLRQAPEDGLEGAFDLNEVRFQGEKALPRGRLMVSFAAFVAFVFLAFAAAGLSIRSASALVALALVALFVLVRVDPFAAIHLSIRAPPVALTAFLVVLIGRLFRQKLLALVAAAILVKGFLVFHPDYWFTDYPIHETLLELVYHRGVYDFVRHFPEHQLQHNIGIAPVGGEMRPFPYPVFFYVLANAGNSIFHAPELWLKLTAALVASLPLLPLGYLARRLSPSPRADVYAGLFYLLIPSLSRSLLLLELSALLGHLFDLIALAVLARLELRLDTPRRFVAGTAAITAALAAYTSAFVHFGLFVGAALVLGRKKLVPLAASGLVAAALGLAAYHPQTVGHLFSSVLPSGATSSPATAHSLPELVGSALARASAFLGAPLILAGAIGLALRIPGLESSRLRLLFWAWASSAAVAYVLRFGFLELFHYQKELYWAGALLAIGAAAAVRTRVAAALVLFAALLAYLHSLPALIDQFYRDYLFS